MPEAQYDESKDSVGQKVKGPVKPVAATVPKKEYLIVDSVNDELFSDEYEGIYPFGDLEVGQAFFVPLEKETSVQALDRMHRAIALARKFYSEPEVDENGDEVWETVIIKTTKRNLDGSIMLDSSGAILVGADAVKRPRLIASRHFVARFVMKDYDDKITEDGILVIRVD